MHWIAALAALASSAACGSGPAPGPEPSPAPAFPGVQTVELPAARDETALLDAVFRIDLDSVEVTFDLYPGESRVQAQAALAFRMRAGQRRPIVHFEPARTASDLVLRLDGQALDVRQPGDARLISYAGTGQVSLEIARDLAAGSLHRLEASYSLPLTDSAHRFFTDVNDLQGRGNEALFPTLNTPQQLLRHVLLFRVHAAEPYLMVGSGLVERHPRADDVQEWRLDTERPVASYTVMFQLAPRSSHALFERRLQDVDVRVLAPLDGVSPEQAFSDLDPWLAELQYRLGPFPMARGLSVVLTQSGGGMEYFGATTTSLRALRHEVFHMYYGTSAVARSYRDSWWDEAINMWYELSANPGYPRIDDGYRSDIVNGRSAPAVGFDVRAYDQGARVFQAVAQEIGGRERMIGFLRELHARRSFAPFTTWDLVDEIHASTGADFRERFRLWLYQGPNPLAATASPYEWLHRVDTRMPGDRR